MKLMAAVVAALLTAAVSTPTVLAFCGFYVAKVDAQLFNRASQVVLSRDEDQTVLTMANDYRGEPKEFAIVIPVPTVLERGQIRVADRALIEHLDAYTSPRLVEYFDENPCALRPMPAAPMSAVRKDAAAAGGGVAERAKSLGVTIEAQLHRRRVRHPDPLRPRERGARDLAARQRLPDPRWRHPRARQLPQAGHALLRRQGQPGGAGQARVQLSPAALDGLRVAKVHAAASGSAR